MINSFKKLALVTTLLTLVTSLVPKSAEAGLARFTGRSTNETVINFDLDTNAPLVDGVFLGAVKNFNRGNTYYVYSSNTYYYSYYNRNLETCGSDICPLANLKVSKLVTNADGYITGLTFNRGKEINLDSLQTVFNSNYFYNINFSEDVVRYDLFFGTDLKPTLIWFVQSSDLSLTTNLSKLSEFSNIQGIFPGNIIELEFFPGGNIKYDAINGAIFGLNSNSQAVPEPNSSLVGLLGVGMLGAASLRYKKRLQGKTVVEEIIVETPEMMQIK
jgi:hypothetical protein